MVGVARMRADGPLNCCLDGLDIVFVLRLGDRSYREQSHVGSMKDRLGLRIPDVFLADSKWREGRDSFRYLNLIGTGRRIPVDLD